tara:strand:- start:4590 stop:5090 length:501 start_codon:yes stop_codon:yes gene_type:complete
MDIETNNGRVDLLNNIPDGTPTFMQDKIPVQSNSNFKNIVKANYTETPVSRAFFSKENVEIIQNGIRAGVYQLSNSQYLIDNQSIESLNVIMSSIYLQYSINSNKNISQQITALNNLVFKECTIKVLNEVKGYMKYKQDISTLSEPIQYPTMSSTKNTELEFKPRF